MKYIINFLLLAFLISCDEQKGSPAPQPEPTEAEEAIVTDTTSFAPPVHVNQLETIDPDSSIIMFPLGFNETDFKFSDDDEPGSFTTSETRSGDVGRYWNVIFYDYKSEESWLLMKNTKAAIQEIHQMKQHPVISRKYLFYTIYSNDLNHDHKLNSGDPAYLYLSDRHGKGLRRLSAENMDVLSWNILPGTETLFLTCAKDANGDKKFTEDDQQHTYRIDLKDVNAVPKEIFSEAFKKEVADQFKKNWKN